jgi:hypothetical protein
MAQTLTGTPGAYVSGRQTVNTQDASPGRTGDRAWSALVR